MKTERFLKESFTVIGKEGSTDQGPGFIQKLWNDANSQFSQIAHLAKKDPAGNLSGIWGAMTDHSRSFLPWEDGFSKGLYLAGVECEETAQPPEGWTVWTVPGYEYLKAECGSASLFSDMITYLQQQQIPLAGAVQDYTCPTTGTNYMLFPIRKYAARSAGMTAFPKCTSG